MGVSTICQVDGFSRQTLTLYQHQAKALYTMEINYFFPSYEFTFRFRNFRNELLKLHTTALLMELKQNYVQTRFHPRNIQSLISKIEVKINGRSIRNISQ